MNKEKWLLKELANWQQESIVSDDVAAILKEKYTIKKNSNFLVILFSVIGSILIGTGIILIGAKNWASLPIYFRVTIAMSPLIVSQGFAVFVLRFRYDSIAWREAIAILVTASVFTAIAMVGQIFHLSGDFGTYVLTCGLLSLPMIYILGATFPLAVYYYTILNWAAWESSSISALTFFGLFALGALYVFSKRKQVNARLVYMTWLTAITGFVGAWTMGNLLDGSILLIILTYFVLLLSVEELPELLMLPFRLIGTIGGLIILNVLTYRDTWMYCREIAGYGFSIMFGIMLLAILYFASKTLKRDKLKFAFLITLALVCMMRYVWNIASLDNWPFEFIFMIISNAIGFLIGVGFIIHGAKNMNLLTTNAGMATICTIIIMRFFDSDMEFLWRGIVFLILGIAFLLVNLKILNVKKKNNQEVTL